MDVDFLAITLIDESSFDFTVGEIIEPSFDFTGGEEIRIGNSTSSFDFGDSFKTF